MYDASKGAYTNGARSFCFEAGIFKKVSPALIILLMSQYQFPVRSILVALIGALKLVAENATIGSGRVVACQR